MVNAMENNADKYGDIKTYIEYLKKVGITQYNFKEHFEDVMGFNRQYGQQLKELERKDISIIIKEDKLNESLQRQGKNIDSKLSLDNANILNAFRKEHEDVLMEHRDMSVLLIDLLFNLVLRAKDTIEMSKGAEIAKAMANEQRNLFKEIHDTVQRSYAKEKEASERVNQRLIEIHEYSMGQIVAKLELVNILRAGDKKELEEKIEYYRKKDDELGLKGMDGAKKEQVLLNKLDNVEQELKSVKEEKKEEKEVFETQINSLKRELEETKNNNTVLKAKGQLTTAIVSTLRKESLKNEANDEFSWKKIMGWRYPIAITLCLNEYNEEITSTESNCSLDLVTQVSEFIKNEGHELNFKEFVFKNFHKTEIKKEQLKTDESVTGASKNESGE